MPQHEHLVPPDSGDEPFALPPELAEFLGNYEYACVSEATNQGTMYVLKAPGVDIESVRGPVPISLRHELYSHPVAPVIRSVLTIYDQVDQPVAFETFVNIDDSQQRTEFGTLATQEELYFLFYDEALAHRLTKVIPHSNPEMITQIVQEADRIFGDIPIDQYDFDQAKAAVIAATSL